MKIIYFHNEVYESTKANLVQVKAMCKAMAKLGHDVVLSLQESKNLFLANDRKNQSYNIHIRKRIFCNKRLEKYLNSKSISYAIKEINPDIIFIRNPLLLRQILKSKIPVIMELHNNRLHLGYKFLDDFWVSFLIKVANEGKISKVVCISQALADFWIKKGIPRNLIIVAHDGVDESQFLKQPQLQTTKIDLGLPLDKKIVTYAGSLYKDRKIENILECAKIYKDVHFLILGGPTTQTIYYKELTQKESIDNVFFMGQVVHENVPEYLFISDVLLALWSSEVKTINYCSPLKIFEYMAAGRIIVAHSFPTIKEVLIDNKNALLVEPDSLVDLINKLGVALSMDYPNSMVTRSREDVLSKYTWNKRAALILRGILNDL